MSLFRGEEEKKQKKTVLLDQLALEVRESAGVGWLHQRPEVRPHQKPAQFAKVADRWVLH